MKYPDWWLDAARLRVGLLKRPQPQVPHLTKPKYAEYINKLDQFAAWLLWFEGGRKGARPKFDLPVPKWAWKIEDEYDKAHPLKPKPPTPPPPPPPKPPPSWKLQNGPWIMMGPGGAEVPAGPWTRLDIKENEICPGAPLWYCKDGDVPQAEGDNQAAACVEWIKKNNMYGDNCAVVTTLGFPVKPFLDLDVTSCFVECFLQEQANALDKMWEAGHEGWPWPMPCVGVYHDFPFSAYAGWLKQYGKNFCIFSSDGMQQRDWDDLREHLA